MAIADIQIREGMKLGAEKLLNDLSTIQVPFERARNGAISCYWTSDSFVPAEGIAADALHTAALVLVSDSSESLQAMLEAILETVDSAE